MWRSAVGIKRMSAPISGLSKRT